MVYRHIPVHFDHCYTLVAEIQGHCCHTVFIKFDTRLALIAYLSAGLLCPVQVRPAAADSEANGPPVCHTQNG